MLSSAYHVWIILLFICWMNVSIYKNIIYYVIQLNSDIYAFILLPLQVCNRRQLNNKRIPNLCRTGIDQTPPCSPKNQEPLQYTIMCITLSIFYKPIIDRNFPNSDGLTIKKYFFRVFFKCLKSMLTLTDWKNYMGKKVLISFELKNRNTKKPWNLDLQGQTIFAITSHFLHIY